MKSQDIIFTNISKNQTQLKQLNTVSFKL